MKKLLAILAVILIFIACDRFEHDFFDKTESLESFLTGFIEDFEGKNTTALESRFADDYLNDGVDKDSMIVLIADYLGIADNVEFQTNNQQPYSMGDQTATISFDFNGQLGDNTDNSFTWDDQAELIGEDWILSGNKSSGESAVEELLEEFATAFGQKDIAHFIHEDYLNEGIEKDSLVALYDEMFAEMNDSTDVTLANTDIMMLGSRARVEFDLSYNDMNDNPVSRGFIDYLISEGNNWLFYGNQETPQEIQKHVVLELWTGVT